MNDLLFNFAVSIALLYFGLFIVLYNYSVDMTELTLDVIESSNHIFVCFEEDFTGYA